MKKEKIEYFCCVLNIKRYEKIDCYGLFCPRTDDDRLQ